MIKDPEAFHRRSEMERTRFLERLTFRKAAALLREILRLGSHLKGRRNDRPVSYDRLLRHRT